MTNRNNHEKGFALALVLVVLSVVSLLGMAILSAATSEHKMTSVDSRSQSAYYVAESGSNLLVSQIMGATNKAQLNAIEASYVDFNTIGSYQESYGATPISNVKLVKTSGGDGNTRMYEIYSTGKIGFSTRKVLSTIVVKLSDPYSEMSSYFGNYDSFILHGQYVSDGTMVVKNDVDIANGSDELLVKDLFVQGDVRIRGSEVGQSGDEGIITVQGDLDGLGTDFFGEVRVFDGDLYFGNAMTFTDDVFVKGNVYFNMNGFSPENKFDERVKGTVYYTGKIVFCYDFGSIDNSGSTLDVGSNRIANNSTYQNGVKNSTKQKEIIANNFRYDTSIADDDWSIPPVSAIEKRDNAWYASNGYTTKTEAVYGEALNNNEKLVVKSYKRDSPQSPHLKNVVIISEGDITIKGSSFENCVLISLNGKVVWEQGGQKYEGVIISNGFSDTNGSSKYELLTLGEVFPSSAEYPFVIVDAEGGGGSGGGSAGIDVSAFTTREQ